MRCYNTSILWRDALCLLLALDSIRWVRFLFFFAYLPFCHYGGRQVWLLTFHFDDPCTQQVKGLFRTLYKRIPDTTFPDQYPDWKDMHIVPGYNLYFLPTLYVESWVPGGGGYSSSKWMSMLSRLTKSGNLPLFAIKRGQSSNSIKNGLFPGEYTHTAYLWGYPLLPYRSEFKPPGPWFENLVLVTFLYAEFAK